MNKCNRKDKWIPFKWHIFLSQKLLDRSKGLKSLTAAYNKNSKKICISDMYDIKKLNLLLSE